MALEDRARDAAMDAAAADRELAAATFRDNVERWRAAIQAWATGLDVTVSSTGEPRPSQTNAYQRVPGIDGEFVCEGHRFCAWLATNPVAASTESPSPEPRVNLVDDPARQPIRTLSDLHGAFERAGQARARQEEQARREQARREEEARRRQLLVVGGFVAAGVVLAMVLFVPWGVVGEAILRVLMYLAVATLILVILARK